MKDYANIEPAWKRLQFNKAPSFEDSGKGIGVVIIDNIKPHLSLRHLGERLINVLIKNDLTIECEKTAFKDTADSMGTSGEHGLMTLLLMAHKPFKHNGEYHTGIAPAANYIILSIGQFKEGEDKRLEKGVEWILENRDKYNIKIILCLNFNGYEPGGWIESTADKPRVKALKPAVEAGILVITPNGNTMFENELPPIEYLAVGGYIDNGTAEAGKHRPYPDEPWGRNGDGYMRPDILAPRLYLPVPYNEQNPDTDGISYFSGTCASAALAAGVCANIWSAHTYLKAETMRQLLITTGDSIPAYENKAPRINADKALRLIYKGIFKPVSPIYPPPLRVENPEEDIYSSDPLLRGLALTMLIKTGRLTRSQIWTHVYDMSPAVRKTAVWALGRPVNMRERGLFWDCVRQEKDGGVRGYWLHGLLEDAVKEEVNLWLPFATDINWTVRWCVSEYLKLFEDCPELMKTEDPDLIDDMVLPIREYYYSIRH
jgi:serine protease AprX